MEYFINSLKKLSIHMSGDTVKIDKVVFIRDSNLVTK